MVTQEVKHCIIELKDPCSNPRDILHFVFEIFPLNNNRYYDLGRSNKVVVNADTLKTPKQMGF